MFLSSVQSLMGLKVRFLCKRFVTKWTAVRFLSSVNSRMPLKVTQQTEWFCTLNAVVGFLLRVNFHMNFKLTWRSEWFSTLTAVKWFLPGVYSHMTLKVTQTRQMFDTIWTTEPPISSCIVNRPENNDLKILVVFDVKPLCAKWLFPTCYTSVACKGLFHLFEAELHYRKMDHDS